MSVEPPAPSIEAERLAFQKTLDDLRRRVLVTQDLYDNAPCGYHALDGGGLFLHVNETELRWLGYAREELVGRKKFSELLTPETREAFTAQFATLKAKGAILDLDFDMVRKDGSVLSVLMNATAVKDASGRFEMSRSTIHDVTSRKKGQEARARLAALVESSDDAIFALDLNGEITAWNSGARALYGYEAAEVLGKSLALLIPPEGAAEAADILGKCRRGEHIVPYEATRVCKDGRRIRVFLTVSPIRDASGVVVGISAIAHDLTQLHLAEDELRQSLALTKAALESTADGILVVGPDGRFTGHNEKFAVMWGMPKDIMESKDDSLALEYVRGQLKDPGIFAARVAELYERPDVSSLDLIELTDGRIFERYSIPQLIEGKIVGRVWSFRDVTESKRAEESIRKLNAELEERVMLRTAQVEAANKDLEAFTYSVSHDLRAPLRTIEGFSRILMEDYAPKLEPECRRYLGLVRHGTEAMGQLIDDLLAFSRLGRQELVKSSVSMEEVVRAAIASLEGQRKDRQVGFQVGALAPCEGDGALLKQIWINLLSNALKFTRRKKEARIEVDSHDEAGETVYRVKDNGAGFDMRYADKLFKVFSRLHAKEEYEGTGVGLAIVARIVERHGGRVWARGEPGRGAEFFFTLGGRPS